MKHFKTVAGLLVAPTFASTAFAQVDDGISVTSTADTVSEYVFRGVSLGAQSLQPGTEISLSENFLNGALNGLSGGVWYSAGIDPDSDVQADEVDTYLNYSLPVGDAISLDIGGTYYYYPQSGGFLETRGGSAGSYEFYGSVGLNDVALSPSATVYYDVTLENLTLEGSIEHGFDLPRENWSAALGLTGGHVDADSGFDYQWATATVGLNKLITDNISFYVNGNFTLNSEDDTLNFEREVADSGIAFATLDSDTKFWFGTGLAVDF